MTSRYTVLLAQMEYWQFNSVEQLWVHVSSIPIGAFLIQLPIEMSYDCEI
jgi:hypothetical protein